MQTILPISGVVDGKAFRPESFFDKRRDLLIVLYQQYSHDGSASSRRIYSMPHTSTKAVSNCNNMDDENPVAAESRFHEMS
jgi:hypothetical protein